MATEADLGQATVTTNQMHQMKEANQVAHDKRMTIFKILVERELALTDLEIAFKATTEEVGQKYWWKRCKVLLPVTAVALIGLVMFLVAIFGYPTEL